MLSIQIRHKLAVILFFTLTLFSSLTSAKPGMRGGPPPEAFEVCKNLTEGAACRFKGRRGEDVKGKCETSPRDELLICAPEGGRPERPDRSFMR